MENTLVKDVMTVELTVASTSHSFSQVLEFFNLSNIRHLPVTKDNEVIGIISIRDVMKAVHDQLVTGETVSLQQMDQSLKVSDLMTMTPVTIQPDATVNEALIILMKGGFHALPVVGDNGKLEGIVTYHDLLSLYFREQNPPAHFSISAPGFGI